MAMYRKKPVIVEARQLTAGYNRQQDLLRWIGHGACAEGNDILIPTMEGVMRATYHDYIIKGVEGEFYPCKPAIFEKTYEVIDD